MSDSGTTTQASFVTSSLGEVLLDVHARFRVDKQVTLILCCSQEESAQDLVIRLGIQSGSHLVLKVFGHRQLVA